MTNDGFLTVDSYFFFGLQLWLLDDEGWISDSRSKAMEIKGWSFNCFRKSSSLQIRANLLIIKIKCWSNYSVTKNRFFSVRFWISGTLSQLEHHKGLIQYELMGVAHKVVHYTHPGSKLQIHETTPPCWWVLARMRLLSAAGCHCFAHAQGTAGA